MSGRGKGLASPNKSSSTMYLNSLKRRIYMGERGGYFALAAGTGKKVYGVKARYMKHNGSSKVMKIVNKMAVPNKIRRKVRSDKMMRPNKVAQKATSTNFITKSGHRIMMGRAGSFFANKNGKRVYKLKAHKRKVGNASPTNIGNHMNVPSPIRLKMKM